MSSDVPFADARAILAAGGLVAANHIEWPNESFDEPCGDPPAVWLSVECIGRVLAPIEVGGETWQEEGTTYVHIMAPLNTGTDAARVLAKSVANLFRNLGPRDVIYRGASIGTGAPIETQGIWWMLTVSLDWVYQDATTSPQV